MPSTACLVNNKFDEIAKRSQRVGLRAISEQVVVTMTSLNSFMTLLYSQLCSNEMTTECSLRYIQLTSYMITSYLPFLPQGDNLFPLFVKSVIGMGMRTR